MSEYHLGMVIGLVVFMPSVAILTMYLVHMIDRARGKK